MLSDAVELMASATPTESQPQISDAVGEVQPADGTYTHIMTVPLDHLQSIFRERIQKRWQYVHTNAMAVAFMLDPATDLDDFVGSDDENVDDQVCKLTVRCGLILSTAVAKLTAEILKFKRIKREGGGALREKYSESNPQDYWGSKSAKRFPLLKKVSDVVFAIPTSSAARERAWGIFDHIHSKRRNGLSVEKVEMLAYVYINYGTIKKEEIDLARHQSCPKNVDDD